MKATLYAISILLYVVPVIADNPCQGDCNIVIPVSQSGCG